MFPQVRLSKFSNALIRDTRDDLLDPSRGLFLSLSSDLSARAIGSEVGFVKTFGQAFQYFRLPLRRRIILATAERIGLAHGFPRTVTTVDETGVTVTQTVQDLPASERFFAGGDTTVRGFSLDRSARRKRSIRRPGSPRVATVRWCSTPNCASNRRRDSLRSRSSMRATSFLNASDLSFTESTPRRGVRGSLSIADRSDSAWSSGSISPRASSCLASSNVAPC